MTESYRDALDDCLQTLRRGGDVEGAIARHPAHSTDLRGDIALASAMRSAGRAFEPPAGAEGRANVRMAAALQQARTGQATKTTRRSGFSFGGWLRPIAIAGVAAVLLAVIGLGALSNNGGGAGTAEAATLEGVVVENANGQLKVQTNTGLETVSFETAAVVQDDASHAVAVRDIAVGQVVKAQGKKPSNGNFVAKQVLSKSPAELQSWCADHGDACQALLPRLEAQVNGCAPADAAQCQRLKQPLIDTKTALQQIGANLGALKDRCDSGGQGACRTLERACKDHPILCQDIRNRQNGSPVTNGGGGPNGNGGPNGGPQRTPGSGRPGGPGPRN